MEKDKQQPEQPAKVGDELELAIAGIGRSGDPFIKFQNFIIFVKGSPQEKYCVGDMVKVKITKISASVGFGAVIE